MAIPEKLDPSEQKITWIPVKHLSVIWPEAQRPYVPSRAKKIADNFDPDRVNPIRVTLPNGDGIYHIVDGQHTKAAIQLLWGEDEKAPCIILGSTEEVYGRVEAAQDFVGTNNMRWRIDPISTFKANVTGKALRECAINRIVEHCDYKVGPIQEGSSRYIAAVSALIAIFDEAGGLVLKTTLDTLSATWPNDPAKTHGSILRGYGLLINEQGTTHINLGHLVSSIKNKYTPGNLLHAAKDDQDTYGGSMGEAVARLLFVTYNRKTEKKLKRKGE